MTVTVEDSHMNASVNELVWNSVEIKRCWDGCVRCWQMGANIFVTGFIDWFFPFVNMHFVSVFSNYSPIKANTYSTVFMSLCVSNPMHSFSNVRIYISNWSYSKSTIISSLHEVTKKKKLWQLQPHLLLHGPLVAFDFFLWTSVAPTITAVCGKVFFQAKFGHLAC